VTTWGDCDDPMELLRAVAKPASQNRDNVLFFMLAVNNDLFVIQCMGP
jgi:hypothetical protein